MFDPSNNFTCLDLPRRCRRSHHFHLCNIVHESLDLTPDISLTCSLASCHRRAPWPGTPRPRTGAGPPHTQALWSQGWAWRGGAWTTRHSWTPGRRGGYYRGQSMMYVRVLDLCFPVTDLLPEVKGEAGRAPDGGEADGPGYPRLVTPHHVAAVT